MNSSNLSIECYEDLWRTQATRLGVAVYIVLPPIYFIVGLFGNTALILTCLQKHNNENPYFYQVLVAASRGLLIVCHTFALVVADGLGNVAWPTPDWWSECYGCVWVSAHLGVALSAFPMAMEPIITTAMLCDRFTAMRKPVSYRQPTKREYVVVSAVSTLIGLGMFLVPFTRFYVVPGRREGIYEIATVTSIYLLVFTHLRNALTVLYLLVSYALNSAICFLYFKRIRDVKLVLSTVQEMKKRAFAKELLIVGITQATFDSVHQLANILFFLYYNTASGPCYFIYQPVVVEMTDLCIVLTTIGQFYVLCIIRPRFRKDARKLFRKTAAVAPT